MTKAIMADLETLAVSPNSVIVSLGAVKFDPYSHGYESSLYLKIDTEDQPDREIDQGTLDWWAKQDSKIIEDTFDPKDRISLADALTQFHKFVWGCDQLWSHGSIFDVVILENALKQLGRPCPWNFWQIRDTRTIFDLGVDPEMPKESKHNALQDAIRQAVGVQNVYAKLKISKA